MQCSENKVRLEIGVDETNEEKNAGCLKRLHYTHQLGREDISNWSQLGGKDHQPLSLCQIMLLENANTFRQKSYFRVPPFTSR